MYKSLFKITTIQKKCQKIIQDFKNHIRYIKKFTQKYQLENVLEEEVEEITTEFIKYINENYLKSCPINQEEKKTFEEASFFNKVWRDFMKQKLEKLTQKLKGQESIERISKNNDEQVTLKLMDLQGIINEMEEWRSRDKDIQGINKEFKRMIRSIKAKKQSNDNEIRDIYYSPLINAGNERTKLQSVIRNINDRLGKYRIVINEKEETKSVIDINEYLRERGIGSINEFLVGRPTNKDMNIVSDWDLKKFYRHVLSRFQSTKIQNLLNQQQFRNSLKTKIQKRVGESSYFSQSITENMKGSDLEKANHMKKTDLEKAKKEDIKILLEKLYLFYDLLNKFLSNEYGIEFIPNFRIIDTTFSEKTESPSILLKQKYLDRIVEIYDTLKADYQKNIIDVLKPPPKATISDYWRIISDYLRKRLGFTRDKNETDK